MSFVDHVGTRFLEAAAVLDIEDPLLAHHDAGGIVYREEPLRLLDLAGLVNRDIAKQLDNPEQLATLILEDHRPDFIFGTDGYFASAIIDMRNQSRFIADYVPLRFVEDPQMDVPICAVRRSSLRVGVEAGAPADVRLVEILPGGEVRMHRELAAAEAEVDTEAATLLVRQ